jgi:hypothetical protein
MEARLDLPHGQGLVTRPVRYGDMVAVAIPNERAAVLPSRAHAGLGVTGAGGAAGRRAAPTLVSTA